MASVLYAAVTLFLCYPLALDPTSVSRLDTTDGRLNAWAISWVAHQVLHDPLHLFEANIFHPLPHTLAFSEHLLLPGLLALPLLLVSNDLVFTFNMFLLLAMFASALGMYILVFSLTGSRSAALLSGLFFSFAPYRFSRLPQIQMQLYAFMPLALASLHRLFNSGLTRWGFVFSGFFLLQALSGTYLAAMTAVASAVCLVTLAPGAPYLRRPLTALALAASLSGAVLFFFIKPYLWVNRTLGIEWDLSMIRTLSATPASYVSSSSRLYGDLIGFPQAGQHTDFLFPGLTLILLGAIGTWVLITDRGSFSRSRATVICYLVILVTGFLISLGPATPLHSLLYQHIVFFRGLRILSRFGLLPLLSLSVLSGYALSWTFNKVRSPTRHYFMVVVIAVLFVGESMTFPLPVKPYRDRPDKVYQWLASEAKPGAIVELPFGRLDTRYMFSARHHHFRPTLNGDSGFIPSSHAWMKQIFLRFPSSDSTALLHNLGVRYVVVHLGAFRNQPKMLLRMLDALEERKQDFLSVGDFGTSLVLEVLADYAASPAMPSLERIEVEGQPQALFDSDIETFWQGASSCALIEVRLGAAQTVSGLRLHYGQDPNMPVNHIEIQTLDQHGQWCPVWGSPPEWPAVAEMVLSLIDNPHDGTQTLVFAPFQTSALQLKLCGYRGPPEIADIEIMEPVRD